MFTPEQSAEQLKKFQDEGFRMKQAQRLAACGGPIALLGDDLLHQGPVYFFHDEDSPRIRRRMQTIQALAKLDARQRAKLFAALFPKLGPGGESPWVLSSRLPYQFHYLRRPFRSPTDNLPFARVAWLGEVIGMLKIYDQDVEW